MSGNTVLKKDVRALQVRLLTSTSATRPTTSSTFSTVQILSRIVHKTEKSLLSNLEKKIEVTGTLAKKFNLRITVHNKSGRKKNKLNER